MHPSSADVAQLLRIATEAAREAGALAAEGWRTRPAVEHKGRIDLVTEFDRQSEILLRERLTRATSIPVVGEEHGGVRAAGGEATWYLDPIDGTTNFVHGHFFWCVSVGLVAGGRPILGVVHAPALGVEWTGIVGRGAWRAEKACGVSDVGALDDALLATGFPYDRRTSPQNNFDAFVTIKKKCQAVRRCGSAALDLCLVADGTYDGYWEGKLKPWDTAAGAAIVEAAGGKVTDYAGAPFDVAGGQVIASNGRIHDALVTELGAFR